MRKQLVLLGLSCLFVLAGGCSDNSDDNVALVLPPEPPSPCQGEEQPTSRLFLQQVTATSAIIKWRGGADAACLGTDMERLDLRVEAATTDGDHKEARFSGLSPDSRYYFSIGAAGQAPREQRFNTAPQPGTPPADGNTRIWLVGDSGTGGDDEREAHEGEAAAVRDGMHAWREANGGEAVDLFLMLGDNAYEVGSDFNYQQAVFETYAEELKSAALWPTIGNHEMGVGEVDICEVVPDLPCGDRTLSFGGISTESDPGQWLETPESDPGRMPYLDIFTLPADGAAGGVASGTEQYYAFDYGNVHVVSLDSQLSARDANQRAAMRQWLIDDLAANQADWTVVIFHHPPYSKGANHDSDDTENNAIDRPQWDMRNEFVPIFDEYGVDVVYSGHSHSYERSYYIRNHTGTSDSYSHAEHAELVDGDLERPASGRGDEQYAQLSPTSGGIDDRVVYTVAGSSGKADEDQGGLTLAEEWLRHPAHVVQPEDDAQPKRNGLPLLGSVIIDAGADSLRASFIDVEGEVKDSFTISR